MIVSKSALTIAAATLLLSGGFAVAQEQGARAGVPATAQGGIEHPVAPPADGYTGSPVGRSAATVHGNSTNATENQRSSGQGSGPRAGNPNGN